MATLSALPNPARGSVRLTAIDVPAGDVIISRSAGRLPEEIRGGSFRPTIGGFIKEDVEPPFGTDLTYTVVDEVDDRYIQTNRVPNPKAAVDTAGWTGGPGRTLDRETAPALIPARDALTSVRVGPNGAGVATGTQADRTLASVAPAGLAAGRWYLSGQMRYDSPDLWLWDDVQAAGTWQAVRDRGSWQQVRSASSEAAGQPFATLWAAVVDGSGNNVVPPFQVLGVAAVSGNAWHTFSAYVEVPAGAPAGSRLTFLHGPLTREYACTFWLSTLLVSAAVEVENNSGGLTYFDGDSVVPVEPAQNLLPGTDWYSVVADAAMAWTGTPHNSTSTFYGPSVVGVQATARVDAPELSGLRDPVVYLSDPVAPQLGVWFGLLGLGTTTRPARASFLEPINRPAGIAVSQKRGWPAGSMQLLTTTLAQRRLVERLFASGRILFLRNPDPRFPESVWYLHCSDLTEDRPGGDQRRPERIWTFNWQRVERPVGLIEAFTGISWADIKAGYTWDALRRTRDDWVDASLTAPGVGG